MATTTNYGWTTPDDTALVKDGAAAIRTLGSSVDTTTKNLNPSTTLGDIEYRSATANTNTRLAIGSTGQVLTVAAGVPSWATPTAAGLTLITTQALSGVTAQSVNNCFNSTYQNYVILFSAYCATSADNPTFKLRASGTDSSATYYSAFTSANWTNGSAATGYTNNGTSWDSRPLGTLDTSSTSLSGTTMTIYSPFAATNTAFTGSYLDARVGSNNGAGSAGGVHNSATSYDGFTITNSTAMTGTVRVYGLAN